MPQKWYIFFLEIYVLDNNLIEIELCYPLSTFLTCKSFHTKSFLRILKISFEFLHGRRAGTHSHSRKCAL